MPYAEINTEIIVTDSSKERVTFHLAEDENSIGSSIIADRPNVKDIGMKATVSSVNILDVINRFEHAAVLVLKLDVEGAEYDVMSKILSSGILCKPSWGKVYVAIEWHGRYGDTSVPKKWRKMNQRDFTFIPDFSEKILSDNCDVEFFRL